MSRCDADEARQAGTRRSVRPQGNDSGPVRRHRLLTRRCRRWSLRADDQSRTERATFSDSAVKASSAMGILHLHDRGRRSFVLRTSSAVALSIMGGRDVPLGLAREHRRSPAAA